MAIELNITLFRQRFQQFAIPAVFPDPVISMQWLMASQYVSDGQAVFSEDMPDAARELALQQMTAHLMALQCIISAGGTYSGQGGVTTAATIDKVSVTLAAPPYGTSAWRFWLNTTPYGQALLALLTAQSVGGFAYGGSPVLGFRGAAGGFR